MPNSDLSHLLSSECFSSHLFPKLTVIELLHFTQISQQCRHSLQRETIWQSALMRNLPAGHPLRSPTTSYQVAAYQYGALQHAIDSGGAAAILRSTDLRQYALQDVHVSSSNLFAICHDPTGGYLAGSTDPGWATNLFTMAAHWPLQALCPLDGPSNGAVQHWSPDSQHLALYWHTDLNFGDTCLNLMCIQSTGTAAVRQLFDLSANTPLLWSPCSTMFSLYLIGESEDPYQLYVLDLDLEVVFAWPSAEQRSAYILGTHPFSQDIVHAWMPSSTLIAVVRPKDRLGSSPPRQALCWNPREFNGFEAQTLLQLKQLHSVPPSEAIVSLVWDVHGLAAITQLGSALHSPGQLYLWLPDGSQASMALHGNLTPRFEPTVQWSPAGNRLLLTCQGVQLISTSCALLLQLPGDIQDTARFSPCGRYLCVVDQDDHRGSSDAWSLAMYSSLDGRKLVAKLLPGMHFCHRVTFSNMGDKVIMTDCDAVFVVQFGQLDGICTASDLCQAVNAACKLITS